MKIKVISIDDLVPYENNPRNNKKAINEVAKSIKEFGFKNPILIDGDYTIINGHTRYQAALKLGLKEVPCVIADDLSEEQIKMLRIVDNKTSEYAKWDMKKLAFEIDDLIAVDFDINYFGYQKIEKKPNERIKTIKSYNLDQYDLSRAQGYYEMPELNPVDHKPIGFQGFNYVLSNPDYTKCVHFYLDDYQFERIWQKPQTYIKKLKYFDCVLTPDFSLYLDMPIAMQVWNTYRSRLIGQMMQDEGITVIPTVSWSTQDSFEFCFDGLPLNATVSVSTIGVKQSSEAFKIWVAGMDEMIKRLNPKRILVYGGMVDYDYKDIEVIHYDNEVTKRMKG